MLVQSSAMAGAFGAKMQYWRRKVAAMSNDEFNKLEPQHINQMLFNDMRSMIPQVEREFEHYRDLQQMFIKEIAAIIPQIPESTVSGIGQGLDAASLIKLVFELMNVGNVVPKAFADSTDATKTQNDLLMQLLTQQGTAVPPPAADNTYKAKYEELASQIDIEIQKVKEKAARDAIAAQAAAQTAGSRDQSQPGNVYSSSFNPNDPKHTAKDAQQAISKSSTAPTSTGMVPADTRIKRVPKSQITLWNKLIEEKRAIETRRALLQSRNQWKTRDLVKYRADIDRINVSLNALKAKYQGFD